MSNHTPGPWNRNIKPARKYTTIFAGRNTHVARLVTEGLSDEEIEANCNLIAAAPDLLAALESLYEYVASPQNFNTGQAMEIIANAVDVMAKAKGKV